MPAKLSIHIPESAVAIHLLAEEGDVVLGRDPEAEIHLRHPSVSRRHARLHCDKAGHWLLHDLNSKNGTRVNGVLVGMAPLEHGRWFALGDVYCEFEIIDFRMQALMQSRAAERRSASAAWSRRLQADTDLQQVLTDLLSAIAQVAECQRAFLLTADGSAGLKVAACLAVQPQDLLSAAFSGSRSAVDRVLSERRPVFLSNRQDRAWLGERASVVDQGIQALACLPLIHDDELLGLVYADTSDEARAFSELDAELLGALVGHASSALAARRMSEQLGALSAWVAVDAKGHSQIGGPPATWTRLERDAVPPQ